MAVYQNRKGQLVPITIASSGSGVQPSGKKSVIYSANIPTTPPEDLEEFGLVITEEDIETDANNNPVQINFAYQICEFYNFRHPTLKPGFVPRYGSLIQNAATLYPKAWEYLQTEEGQLLCKTEAEWQAMSKAIYFTAADGTEEGWNGIGGVPFFVQDLAAGTLRVPDTRGMYSEDAGFDSLNIGGVHADGVRDASFTMISSPNNANVGVGASVITGDFTAELGKQGGAWSHFQVTSGSAPPTYAFSLSRGIPVANSVKPRAFGVLPCVYLGA